MSLRRRPCAGFSGAIWNSTSGATARCRVVIQAFDSFQSQIIQELQIADETIASLKLEVERLERESSIDPLTKAHNRRVLVKDLEEVLSFGKERDLDMHLIMFDADDFKKINDSFGHIAGDKTLDFPL